MAENRTVTALVGRFDPLCGLGLMAALRSDRRICVLANEVEQAALEREVERRRPRIAIVDETVKPLLLGRLRAIEPAIGVVVLAYKPSSELGLQLLASEATCISRSATIAEILAAIHFTAQGGRVLAPSNGNSGEGSYSNSTPALTPREIEVLVRIRAKRTNPESARELHVSGETVKSHVASIRRKLKVKSKREC